MIKVGIATYYLFMRKETMSKESCPFCEKTQEIEIIKRSEKATIKGKNVCFESFFCKCTVCKKEFQTMEQLDNSLEAARLAYEKQYEIIEPEKIIELRSK